MVEPAKSKTMTLNEAGESNPLADLKACQTISKPLDLFKCAQAIDRAGFEIEATDEIPGAPEKAVTDHEEKQLPDQFDPNDPRIKYKTIADLPLCSNKSEGPIKDKRFFDEVQVVFQTTELGKDWVRFINRDYLSKLQNMTPVSPPGDRFLQRVQAAGILLKGEEGIPVPQLGGKLTSKGEGSNRQLCRADQKDKQGHLPVFAYQKGIWLQNYCRGIELTKKPLRTENLTDYEVSQLVIAGELGQNDYCIHPDQEGHISIPSDANARELIMKGVNNTKTLTAAQKAKIKRMVDAAFVAEDKAKLRELLEKIARYFGLVAAPVGLVMSILTFFLFRSNKRIAERQVALQESMAAKMDEKKDTTQFLEDHTERAKEPGYSRLIGETANIRKITRTTLKPEMRNILLSGPAGAGKSETVRGFFHQVASGQIENLKGYKLYSFNAEAFAGEGAKWVGEFEKNLSALLERANQEPCIIYVEEAHLLKGMGSTTGNDRDILELLKRHMSSKDSKVIIILDTNKPEKLLQDPAIARRVTHIIKDAPTFGKARAVFEKVQGQFTNGFKLTEEAKDAIVHLAGSHDGARVSGAIDILQTLIAEARMDGKTSGALTDGDVVRFFATEYKMTEEAVRALIAFSKKADEVDLDTDRINTAMKAMKGASAKDIQTMIAELSKIDPKNPGGGTGTPPPDDPGRAGGAGPERTGSGGEGRKAGEAKPSGDANRVTVILEEKRVSRTQGALEGAGGFVAGIGPFVAADVLEGMGIITPEEKEKGVIAWFGGLTLFDAAVPIHLLALGPIFDHTSELVRLGADRAGVKYNSTFNKVIGTVGSGLAIEGGVIGLGFAQGAKTLKAAHETGAQFLDDALTNSIPGARFTRDAIANFTADVKTVAVSGFQTVRGGLQMYAEEALDWAKGAAAAGTSLVTAAKAGVLEYGPPILEALDAGAAMVTPMIMVGDLSLTKKGEEM